jgi:hypothetical protein
VEEAAPEGWLSVADALARLPADAVARVAPAVRERVLALAADDEAVPGGR